MSERLDAWMDGYVLAWSTNDLHDISALFSPAAVYDPQTSDGEWEGLDQIIEQWQEIADQEGNWDFEWAALVETDELAVVTARTRYYDPPASYRNLFVIRFDHENRCYDFTEWYIEEDDT
ncbi:MAG: nuclear transport factor 2 family protein [Acidimicrobiia bacterium]